MKFLSSVVVLYLLACASASAELRVPTHFGNHMVLQQRVPIVIYGWASPHEVVSARFGRLAAKKRAGADGAWSIEFPPQNASAAGRAHLRIGAGGA